MIRSLFFGTLFFITSFAFAQEPPSAQWAKNNITVDGNPQDWNSLKHYDNQTKLFFDFKNDSNNLYLCFQTKDEMNQAKIMRSGMKIILSDKINGKHKSTINFPLGVKHTSKSAESKDKIQPDPLASHPSRHAAFLASDTMMEIKGFANKNGLISSNDMSAIHVAMNWDSANTLTYEIAIPFKELFGNNYNLKDISDEISMNVIINPMPVSDLQTAGNRYSERGENGSDGMEHGNRMEQYNRAALYQKTELKQKFSLVTPDSNKN